MLLVVTVVISIHNAEQKPSQPIAAVYFMWGRALSNNLYWGTEVKREHKSTRLILNFELRNLSGYARLTVASWYVA